MPAQRPVGKRRWIKGVVLTVVGTIVVLMALVAAAPILISAGVGDGFVRSAIEDSIHGTVEFDRLRVSWIGSQSIEGLKVTDLSGVPVADLNVRVDAGLFALLWGSMAATVVDLDGDVHGRIRDDGSLSFADLARPAPAAAAAPARGPDEPPRLDGVGPTTLRLNGLQVTIDDEREHETYVFQDLTGTLAYVPGGTSNVRLSGGVRFGEDLGSIFIDAVTDGLFDRRGVLHVDGAVVRTTVRLRNVPVPRFGQHVRRLNALDLTLNTENLGERIDLESRLETMLPSGGISVLAASISALEPVSAAGRANFSVERVTGTISGRDVPSALLRPLLASTPVEPVRDFGPTIDIAASCTGGNEKPLQVTISGERAGLTLSGIVNATDQTVVGNRLDLVATVHPELLEAVSDYSLSSPAPITVNVPYFTVPPLGSDGKLPLDRIRAAGSIILVEPAHIVRSDDGAPVADIDLAEIFFAPETADPAAPVQRWAGSINIEGTVHPGPLRELAHLPAEQPAQLAIEISDLAFDSPFVAAQQRFDTVELRGTITADGPLPLIAAPKNGDGSDGGEGIAIQYARIQINAPRLGDGARVQGSAGLAGGTLTFDEQVRGMVDADGRLDLGNLIPVGIAELRGVKPGTLAGLVPDRAALIEAASTGPLSARIITSVNGATPQARVFVFGGGTEISANLTRRGDGLYVDQVRASLRVTPALLAAVQAGADPVGADVPLALGDQALITVDVDPLLLPGQAPITYKLGKQPIIAHVAAGRVQFSRLPSLTAPLDVHSVKADVTARIDDPMSVVFNGSAQVRDPVAGATLADLAFDGALRRRGESWRPSGVVTASALEIGSVERLLELSPGAAADWLGATGTVTARLVQNAASMEATIQADLPQLRGSITATRIGEQVSIGGKDLRLTMRRDVLQRLLNAPPPPGPPGSPAPEPRLRVGDHVPVHVAIEAMQLPTKLFAGEPFDPESVQVRVKLTSNAIHLVDDQGTRSTLKDLSLAVLSSNLRTGIEGKLLGAADVQVVGTDSAATPAGIQLNVSGRVFNIVGADSMLHGEQARLELVASLSEAPSALVDALLDFRGLLVAAVGPRMNATLTAANFSPDSGTLDMRIDTTYGWLEGRLVGAGNALHVAPGTVLKAELDVHEPFRERLLVNLTPLFRDISSTKDPLRLTVTSASIPADGDVSRLSAELELTVGDVKILKSSNLFALMREFNDATGETIDGHIKPIFVRIRDGIVTYEQLVVIIGTGPIIYRGTIDLVKQTIDLRTEVSLSVLTLGEDLKDAQAYADRLLVPIVTRGTISDCTTEVDPAFDLGAAIINAGVGGAIDDLLKKQGGDPLGDLLKEILKPPRKP